MLTLRTLKELIDTPKRGEKLPTPKQLRTGESPVVAHGKHTPCLGYCIVKAMKEVKEHRNTG